MPGYDDWRTLFTTGVGSVQATLDGSVIDGATFDAAFVISNEGKTLGYIPEPVPEPASASLLLIGGLGVLARRRRRKRSA